jgi:hypothetical protein
MVRDGAPSTASCAGLEKDVDIRPPPTTAVSDDSAMLVAIISRRTLSAPRRDGQTSVGESMVGMAFASASAFCAEVAEVPRSPRLPCPWVVGGTLSGNNPGARPRQIPLLRCLRAQLGACRRFVLLQPFGGKKTMARTSMLSRGGASGGASGFSNEVWNDSLARPSFALS